MPQASEDDRAAYRARFGDIGPEHAIAELKGRGWTLTPGWEWIPPSEHAPTPEELDWIYFLIAEWDFGGLVQA